MCVQQALFNCNNILLVYIPPEKRLDVTLCLPVKNRVQNGLWNSSVHLLHNLAAMSQRAAMLSRIVSMAEDVCVRTYMFAYPIRNFVATTMYINRYEKG